MKYKIIASDFDGTIFSHESFTVPENVKHAIDEYIKEGGNFVITTGRMFDSLLPHLKRLDLHGKVLCLQGAMCYDIDTEEELYRLDINVESALLLLKTIEKFGWTAQIYIGRKMYTVKENTYSTVYSKLCSIDPVYVGYALSEFVRKNNYSLHKCIIMSKPEDVPAKIEILRKACPDLDFSTSTPEYIEAVDRSSGKGNSLLKYASSLGLSADDIAAFGDQTNDISMLKIAAFSAAPINAVDSVKAIVDRVVDHVENGGLAQTITEITYGNKS